MIRLLLCIASVFTSLICQVSISAPIFQEDSNLASVVSLIENELAKPIEYQFVWKVGVESWDAERQVWVWNSTEHSSVKYFDGFWSQKGVLSSSRGDKKVNYAFTLLELYTTKSGQVIELTRMGKDHAIPVGMNSVLPPEYVPISFDRPPHEVSVTTNNRSKSILYFLTGQVIAGKAFHDVVSTDPKVRMLSPELAEIICDSTDSHFEYQFSIKPYVMLRSLRFELGPSCEWDGKTLESNGIEKIVRNVKVEGDFENRIITDEYQSSSKGTTRKMRTVHEIVGLKASDTTEFWKDPVPIANGTEVANLQSPYINYMWSNGRVEKLVGESSKLVGEIDFVPLRTNERIDKFPDAMVSILVAAGVIAGAVFLFFRKSND